MNKVNYQKILDKEIEKIITSGEVPTLLLHSCCAPCSSYVIEYLSRYFKITVFYYNPNISPESEYMYRAKEQQKLINNMETKYKVNFLEGEYMPEEFYHICKGLENAPEGRERCLKCFDLRLRKTAQKAKEGCYDYFTTTLTISPLKNSQIINSLGKDISDIYGIKYLFSDFKKREGYKRSIVLSEKYNLYRQNYCGCVFSRKQSNSDKYNI